MLAAGDHFDIRRTFLLVLVFGEFGCSRFERAHSLPRALVAFQDGLHLGHGSCTTEYYGTAIDDDDTSAMLS